MKFLIIFQSSPESLLDDLLNQVGNVFKQNFLIVSKQKNVKPE